MPDPRETFRLTADEVTAPYDATLLNFETTTELPVMEAIFGQERAVRAIEFALGMQAPGYNLFASGPDGLGKTTIVSSFLRRRAAQTPAPLDWAYLHNFDDPDRPVAISLPPGQGRRFAEAVRVAVEVAGREIRGAFESDTYARQRQQLGEEIDLQRQQHIEALQKQAEEIGFALQFGPAGIVSAPLINGRPTSDDLFAALPQDQRDQITARRHDLDRVVQDTLLTLRALDRAAAERAAKLDADVAAAATRHLFEPVLQAYGADIEVREFIEKVDEDLRSQRDRLRSDQPQPAPVPAIPGLLAAAPATRRYEVNVVVANDPQCGAPVIVESHPTYYNLLGRIEYQGQFGTAVTDHTMIRPGSLALANGGYLLVHVRDLLQNPQSLDGLKRALSSGRLAIENIAEAYGLVPTVGLRPEPLPLNVKVVIVGDPYLYGLMYQYDPDFRELFRVKADFETDFPRTPENASGLASVIRAECDRASLLPFGRASVARLVEYSSRMVEDQRRLSANIAAFLDVVRQADYWARQSGERIVTPAHVDRAIDERVYRSSLVGERILAAMNDGTIYVPTEGSAVGQINALSVHDLGDISIGRPSRITCIVSAGRGTIVMVERESEMAGRIHNKGFLILRGFLADRFGQEHANALHASLTFEQLYGEIDGDSASSTETYALLSALSEQPIDQQVAVTGSVDQHGRIQPIGGAIAKIEGFYDICAARGLNGRQGVMLPRTNVANVILRPDVGQAIRDGRFHVWAIDTIEEGIELLTGVPAGATRGADGHYPPGTIFRMVEDRLAAFAQRIEDHPGLAAGAAGHVTLPAPQRPSPPPGIPPAPPPEPPIGL